MSLFPCIRLTINAVQIDSITFDEQTSYLVGETSTDPEHCQVLSATFP